MNENMLDEKKKKASGKYVKTEYSLLWRQPAFSQANAKKFMRPL